MSTESLSGCECYACRARIASPRSGGVFDRLPWGGGLIRGPAEQHPLTVVVRAVGAAHALLRTDDGHDRVDVEAGATAVAGRMGLHPRSIGGFYPVASAQGIAVSDLR